MKKLLCVSAGLLFRVFLPVALASCLFSCAPQVGVAQIFSSSVAAAGLENYVSCHFDDGLQVAAVDPLAPGVKARSVTTGSGEKQVDMSAGYRVMFAYPDNDFFANAKVEKLPADRYAEEKQILLENYRYLQSGEQRENTSLTSPMNGFEVHGLDRRKLEGGVLGFYLLFEDRAHIALSIFMLNQEPNARKFQTMDEYAKLRDQYLRSYTKCIQANELANSLTK